MKLQNLFSQAQYDQCLEKIKQRESFNIYLLKKPYKFKLDFRECNNGVWKDDLMVSYGADFRDGGFSSPAQYDEMPSYQELCDKVNSFWEYAEKRDQEEFHNVKD